MANACVRAIHQTRNASNERCTNTKYRNTFGNSDLSDSPFGYSSPDSSRLVYKPLHKSDNAAHLNVSREKENACIFHQLCHSVSATFILHPPPRLLSCLLWAHSPSVTSLHGPPNCFFHGFPSCSDPENAPSFTPTSVLGRFSLP